MENYAYWFLKPLVGTFMRAQEKLGAVLRQFQALLR